MASDAHILKNIVCDMDEGSRPMNGNSDMKKRFSIRSGSDVFVFFDVENP